MPQYKITFGFMLHTVGATESYITRDVTGTAANAYVQNLINLRNVLIFPTVQWTGIRIAQIRVADGKVVGARRSTFYPPGLWKPFDASAELNIPVAGSRRPPGPDDPLENPDQARTCMHVQLTYDADRRVIRYFNYPPDHVIEDEPRSLRLERMPDWRTDLGHFFNALVGGAWGIKGRTNDTANKIVPVLTWRRAEAGPGYLGIEVDNSAGLGAAVGSRVQIRNVVRRGMEKLSYNGIYQVASANVTQGVGTSTFYLSGTEAGDTATIKQNGTAQVVAHTIWPILKCEPIRAGIHHRGKPLGSPVGSHRKRVYLGS